MSSNQSGKRQNREIGEKMLAVDVSEGISRILNQIDEQRKEWVPIGGQPNNYGIVENQQSDPMAAFTELIVNSLDAILLKNYFKEYSRDHPGDEYTDLHTAATELLDRNQDQIRITATGEQNGPVSYTLFDNGIGQLQSDFETTFLGVLEPGQLKQDYGFLQGKYGMGSTGVLPFCGEGYKLIISASVESPRDWSWSLIRKNRDRAQYEYLRLDGSIPTFSGNVEGEEHGTFIKVYSYQSNRRRRIEEGFRKRLERYLVRSPLPIQLIETRYEDEPYSVSTRGIIPRLTEYRDYIEGSESLIHNFGDQLLGERRISIILLKSDDRLEKEGLDPDKKSQFVGGEKHRKQAIFFTVNGQTHGDQGKTFIRNRCNYNRIANDTLVFVTFDDIADSDIVDLFKPSRDRLQSKPPAKALKNELEEVLDNSDLLDDEERRRRTKLAKEKQDEQVENLLQNIVSRNESLLEYFASGQKPPAQGISDQEDEIEYEGQMFPSKFNLIGDFNSRFDYELWTTDEPYVVEVPINRQCIVRFELDAENNYLTRDVDSGRMHLSDPELLTSAQLKYGVLSVTLSSGQGHSVGDEIDMTVEIEPDISGNALSETLRIHFTDRVEETRPTSTTTTSTEGIDLPESTPVYRDDWDEFDFDEYSVVEIAPGREKTQVYINMDAAGVQNFLARNNLSEKGKEHVKRVYDVGITLYSVALYTELERSLGEDTETDIGDLVRKGMKGIGQILLDQTLSDEELEDFRQ